MIIKIVGPTQILNVLSKTICKLRLSSRGSGYRLGENQWLKKTVDVREVQTRLMELLALVQEGTEIIAAQDNEHLTRLVSVASATKVRVAGLHTGAIWTSDDFDGPLPEEPWAASQ